MEVIFSTQATYLPDCVWILIVRKEYSTFLWVTNYTLFSQTIYQVIPSFDKFIHSCCGLT